MVVIRGPAEDDAFIKKLTAQPAFDVTVLGLPLGERAVVPNSDEMIIRIIDVRDLG